jgi:hypothetical protein
MPEIPSFDDYVASLGRLTAHVDPTAASSDAARIKEASNSLADLDEITAASLTAWAVDHPAWVNVLGVAVGFSQEKLKMILRHHLGTSGWVTLARERPGELIDMLDRDFDLIRLITVQRRRAYDFGDILVARATTRNTATRHRRSPGDRGNGRRSPAPAVHHGGHRRNRLEEPPGGSPQNLPAMAKRGDQRHVRLATLDRFRHDLKQAAVIRHLLD